MKSFGRATIAASIVVFAATTAPQANAQNLFDMLFGGGIRKREEFPEPPPVPKKTAPVQKISAPSYYDYKVDPLVRADLSAIRALSRPATFEPMLAGSAFREAVAGLDDFDLRTEKDVATALVDYYTANPDFIWVSGLDPNGRAREAVRTLGDADSFGLNAAEYAVTVPRGGYSLDNTAERSRELIRFEMALSARVLRYVRDAQGGRIDPNRLSGYHDFPAKPVDLVAALKALAHTQEVRAYLESRHPQNPQFQALRVELETLRASAENQVVVDAKLLLKPGQSSPELPKVLSIIARDLDDEMGGEFGETLARLASSEVYVEELVPAVKAAQERAGLKGDGVIGPRTVAALAGTSKADRLDKVLIALEQLRWLPSDLGSPRVFVNQPAFTASYIEGEEVKLSMRVVIGKPSNQTSFFYDEIEQVDYNPYWGVPQSIIVNEMLPRLRGDPGYLDRAGYEVTDASGRRIPSSSIDWGAYGSQVPFNVRQTPSEANALGELKILFPNKHAIYMHDTPSKSLFERDVRAFSHGCIRLQNPRGMAAAVLGRSVDYVAQKLKQGHSSEKLLRKIPIYVSYFTAWPDQHGKVEYFADIYDRDARVLKAIEKTDAVRLPAG
ncbi:MAG TPA: murein L,D-transpeptidase [Rhizobiales bacterium]|nr:murein L,D-transpeptidase [Hyphomicrobiales bacterium]